MDTGLELVASSALKSDVLCIALASAIANSCCILARSLLAFQPSTWSVVIGVGLQPCAGREIGSSWPRAGVTVIEGREVCAVRLG